MNITVACPNLMCQKRLQVGGHLRGKKVKCPSCGQVFGVPERKRPAAQGVRDEQPTR